MSVLTFDLAEKGKMVAILKRKDNVTVFIEYLLPVCV